MQAKILDDLAVLGMIILALIAYYIGIVFPERKKQRDLDTPTSCGCGDPDYDLKAINTPSDQGE